MRCPKPSELLAYEDAALDPQRMDVLSRHVLECRHCIDLMYFSDLLRVLFVELSDELVTCASETDPC